MANAQIIHFPDANFKNALVNTKCVDTDGDNIGDSDADLNDDGEVDESEARAVKRLKVEVGYITNMLGITKFINLTHLDCSYNKLSNLDVTDLEKLIVLKCDGNRLNTLKVDNLVNLEELNFSNNQLGEVDLKGLAKLEKLVCYVSQLNALDVSSLLNLKHLLCGSNNLSTLDVSYPSVQVPYVLGLDGSSTLRSFNLVSLIISSVFSNHSMGFISLAAQEPKKEYIMAIRCAPSCDPANK